MEENPDFHISFLPETAGGLRRAALSAVIASALSLKARPLRHWEYFLLAYELFQQSENEKLLTSH
ncbi:MAG TPA: hypothetical protein VJZ26_08445 [Blastocatellia bacterium]|nr:hypothetical protein [Blastocatellia bacterium]